MTQITARRIRIVAGLVMAGLVLAGCTGIRQSLGLEKSVPDEFTVVRKAPLTLPPDFGLRPPQPGAPRPSAINPTQQAQAALGGASPQEDSERTPGEVALLREAGVAQADSNIRRILLAETTQLSERDESFVDRLIFWRTDSEETVVDATAEARRLRQAALARDGTSTAQETPTIRRRSRSLLRGFF